MVIARLSEDEYSPEFGSVVIRDGVFGGAVDGGLREPALLAESAGPSWGTVARAGAGWLQLNATDEYQRVLIEAHDGAPAPETEAWRDVLETPYLGGTGAVGFTTTTSGPAQSGTLPVDSPFLHHPLVAWEDPGHVLVAVRDTMYRLDVATGAYETAATGLFISCFVEAWPHKPAS